MEGLPKVVATSVIRSSYQGDSHGGVYVVDLGSGDFTQVVDWNDPKISWEGRGVDRGLRGIAFHDGHVFIAASDELLVYDREFELVDSFRNPYLRHCHEIHGTERYLWLTSTGHNAVLGFDLATGSFSTGYELSRTFRSKLEKRLDWRPRYSVRLFDPGRPGGPPAKDTAHLNNVWVHDGALLVSGTGLHHLLKIVDQAAMPFARIPRGTHNAQPFRDGVLVNHTAGNQIAHLDHRGRLRTSFPIVRYDERKLINASLPSDHARQAFGRGLCTWDGRFVIGGSSPATISAFDFETGAVVARVNLTMDVRNAVHGLEVWPF
jgi:hypothetical protein